MYFLEPVYHRTIWGGNRLKSLVPDCPADLAHLYLASGHLDINNRVAGENMTLRQLFELKKAVWHMPEFAEFPLTIALVDASENLSIQVHPDAASALRFEGEATDKTESWVFLEPPAQGWIYCGLSAESIDSAAKAVQNGSIESLMRHYPAARGDCICVRSGTPHALTAGSLVFEVEFGSNHTYRLFDYNRRDKNGMTRNLDTGKGLASLRPDIQAEKCRPIPGEWARQPEYEIKTVSSADYYENRSKRLECLSVIKGSAAMEGRQIQNCFCVLLEAGERLEAHIETGMAVRLGSRYGNQDTCA